MTTIAISSTTRSGLEKVRPRGFSLDQVLGAILKTRPLDDWREILEAESDREVAVVMSRRASMLGAPSTRRDPSEQIMLANAALQRWQLWEQTGRVKQIGPRKFVYRILPTEGPRVRIKRVR